MIFKNDAIKNVKNGLGLKELHNMYSKDKDFILDAIKYDHAILKEIDKKLLEDKSFVLRLLNIDGSFYQFISKDLQLDRDVCITAVKKSHSRMYNFIPRFLQDDKEIRLFIEEFNFF